LRKKCFVVLSLISTTFLAGNLAEAIYEKPKPPIPPPGTIRVVKKMQVRVTAYYGPRKGQTGYAHGSYKKDVRVNGQGKEPRSGTVPNIGTAAADWRILKRGTKFRLPECDDILLGTDRKIPVRDIIFEVQDTGSGVKGRHVDLFTGFGDHGRKIAEKVGSRKMTIEVVQCLPQD
jgi:3D (Asp-Asp-Asp) domain-containing protein